MALLTYFRKHIQNHASAAMLLATVMLFAAASPVFFTMDNLLNLLAQNAYMIIAALGAAIVMLSGGIDLSIGYQISLTGALIALMLEAGAPMPLVITGGIGIGILLGVINGLLATRFKVNTMITTLGTMTVFQGLCHMLLHAKSIYVLSDNFRFIGQGSVMRIPFSFMIALAMLALAAWILRGTWIGRYIYVVGDNKEAAKYAGIDVDGIRLLAFTLCGFFTAVATILLLGRTGSASISIGAGAEFTAMTAAVLGGISYRGGKGRIAGVLPGVFILGIVSNGMQLVGLGIYSQHIVKGMLLLAAISVEAGRTERR